MNSQCEDGDSAGETASCIIGSYFFDGTVSGVTYLLHGAESFLRS